MFNRLCITAGTFGLALILLFGRDVATYLTQETFTIQKEITATETSNSQNEEVELGRFHELANRLAKEVRAKMVSNTRERIEIRELQDSNHRPEVIKSRQDQLLAAEHHLKWITDAKTELIEALAGLSPEANPSELSQMKQLSLEIEERLGKEQTTTALHFMEGVVPVAVEVPNQSFAANMTNSSAISVVEEVASKE